MTGRERQIAGCARLPAECLGTAPRCDQLAAYRGRVEARRKRLVADRDRVLVGGLGKPADRDRAKARRLGIGADRDAINAVSDRSVTIGIAIAAKCDRTDLARLGVAADRDACRVGRRCTKGTAIGVTANRNSADAKRRCVVADYCCLVRKCPRAAADCDRTSAGCARESAPIDTAARPSATAPSPSLSPSLPTAIAPTWRASEIGADGNSSSVRGKRTKGAAIGIAANGDTAGAERGGIIAIDRRLSAGGSGAVARRGRAGRGGGGIDPAFGCLGGRADIAFGGRIGRGGRRDAQHRHRRRARQHHQFQIVHGIPPVEIRAPARFPWSRDGTHPPTSATERVAARMQARFKIRPDSAALAFRALFRHRRRRWVTGDCRPACF